MNLQQIFSCPLVQRLGWMLVHSLWEGALLAFVLLCLLTVLRRCSAGVRYQLAGATMLAMLLLPVATLYLIGQSTNLQAALGPQAPPSATIQPAQLLEQSTNQARFASLTTATPTTTAIHLRDTLTSLLPWFVAFWAMGVAAMSLWHFGGWIAIRRLRCLGTSSVEPDLQSVLQKLQGRLAIHRPVRLLQSLLVQSPVVIGFIKPVILLPSALLTGLTPVQLEAILAHELAHVARYDHLLNLLQAVVETLMFYHPAVWWVSRRMRLEREHCCDDVAVRLSQSPVRYAEALATIEESRLPVAALAARGTSGGSGGDLINRVSRILGFAQPSHHPGHSILAVLLTVAAVALAGALTNASSAPETESGQPQPTSAPRPTDEPPLDPKMRAIGEEVHRRITTYTDTATFTLADGQSYDMPLKPNAANVSAIRVTAHIVELGTAFDLVALDASGNPLNAAPCHLPQVHDDDETRTGVPLPPELNLFCKVQVKPTRQPDTRVTVEMKVLFAKPPTIDEINAMLLTEGKSGRVQLDMNKIVGRINRYKRQHGQYPAALADLNMGLPNDVYSPTAAPYGYEAQPGRFIISSCGKDGIYGNDDDEMTVVSAQGSSAGTRGSMYPLPPVLNPPNDGVQVETLGHTNRRPHGNCSISGQVLAEATGQPVHDAKVYLFAVDTHDAIFIDPAQDGSFIFKDIPAGTYSLSATHAPGLQPAAYNPLGQKNGQPRFGPEDYFKLEPGQLLSGVLFRLKPSYRISGKVLDPAGQPISGAALQNVLAWQERDDPAHPGLRIVSQMPIDLDGTYTLDGLDGRPVYVTFTDFLASQNPDAYPFIYYPTTFSRSQATPIRFEKGNDVDNVDIRLRKGGGLVLQGCVIDTTTGNPIPNALVVVHHVDMLFDRVTGYTDAQGAYRIDSLGEGPCAVHVDASPAGFVRYRKTVTLNAGDPPKQLDFTLAPGLTLRGKFVRPDGSAAQIGPSAFGQATVINAPQPQSSYSGTRHKDAPHSVNGDDISFAPGEGPYIDSKMIVPDRSCFLIVGLPPGQTRLNFEPKSQNQHVLRYLRAGRELPQGQFRTQPGEAIDDLSIVLEDESGAGAHTAAPGSDATSAPTPGEARIHRSGE